MELLLILVWRASLDRVEPANPRWVRMTQPIGELTDRMREIFGLVVEAYLERGQPIGSKALAGTISLSPASIRGVMQELEERGLLAHPHTSAGRMPTDSGLRLFVDGMMQAAAPDPRERREIERQIARDQPIEDALAAASAALVGPVAGGRRGARAEAASCGCGSSTSFLSATTRALAVLVGADGCVENRVVSLDAGTTAAALTEVSNFINARLGGLTLAEAEARLRAEIRERKEAIDAAAAELVASGLAAWSQDHARRPVLIVRGQANLIDAAAAEDLERVRRLLDELEEAQEIARLLEGARDAPGCRIFIGSENRMFALSGSSVIAAPYRGSQGAGGRRCRRDRPDAVELCPRRPHGGFHCESTDEIDGMTETTKDEEQLHDEAEEIRKRNCRRLARGRRARPLAELEKQLEEAKAKVLYAAAETQNVRRRLEAEKEQASSYAAAQFARDMLAIKDHLDRALAAVNEELRATRSRASSSPASNRRRASSMRSSRATVSAGSSRSAKSSTRTVTRR